MSKKVINVALLGLGTVGTGVYKVLKMQWDDMEDKIGARAEIKKNPGEKSEKGCG